MSQQAYNDDTIETMSFTEHLRSKSGMYAFQLHNIQGLFQQLKEIVDNSVDEALDKNKVYPIDITFFVAKDKSTYQCLVQDHGRGIPVGKLAKCYTTFATSGKYRGNYGGISSGVFGVGSKASAALSKTFIAFTKRDDGFGYLMLEKGTIKYDYSVTKRVDRDQSTVGTTVFLQPDDTMFSRINEMFKDNVTGEDYKGIDKYLSNLEYYNLFRNNIDITVRVVDGLLKPKDFDKKPEEAVELWRKFVVPDSFGGKIVFKSNRGVSPREFVISKFNLKEPVWDLGAISKETDIDNGDNLSYHIDLFADEKSVKGSCGIVGAVNGTPISHPESSHILVLQNVIKDHLTEFIEDSDARAFFESRYHIPYSGFVSVGWLGAEFIGQDKSRFENRQFSDYYRASLRKALRKITDERGPVFWETLWDLIKENFDAEYSRFSRRSLGLGKNSKNLMYDLMRPKCFKNCKSDNNEINELFIAEGDSAAGRILTERDEDTQAIYILGGKPQNAIRVRERSKLEKNAIYSDLVKVLNVTPASKDLSQMRFKYILITTDADPDGYHIAALILGILYKINPLILEEGRVLLVNPPLYAIKFGNKVAYMRDENALRDIKTIWYRTLFDIDISVDGGKTSKNLNTGHLFMETTLADGTKVHRLNKNHDEFRNLCMVVDHIGEVVTHQADLLNVDFGLIEQLLHCVDALDEKHVDTAAIKNTMLECDDVIWDKDNNVLIIVDSQGIENRVPLAGLQNVLKGIILPLYQRANWDKFDLFVSTKYTDKFIGQPCTFMMLYQIFKDLDGLCEITRFKGLGEMGPEDIAMTCINKSTRCFTTIRGIGDLDTIYKMLDADTDARKKLIDNNYLD